MQITNINDIKQIVFNKKNDNNTIKMCIPFYLEIIITNKMLDKYENKKDKEILFEGNYIKLLSKRYLNFLLYFKKKS